jgi:hypothetical protein
MEGQSSAKGAGVLFRGLKGQIWLIGYLPHSQV